MGFGIPNPVDVVKTVARKAEDVGETVVKTTVNITETTIEVGKDTVVSTVKFQADITRIGLEKTLDATKAGINLFEKGFDAVTHPGDPNPPSAQGLKFSETKSACDIAYKSSNSKVNDVYQFPDGKQWKVVDVKEDPQTGFRAVALRPVDPNDKRVVVAFSGSDEGKDWDDNLKQGVGLSTAQYDQAVAFADKWKAVGGSDTILTGHSLGGGLASYASIKTDLRATAVNSAPLALNHLGLNPFDALRITQYYVPGEALSVVNEANPLDVRPGANIAVQGEYSILDPRSIGRNHSLDSVAPDIPAPKYVGNFN